MVRLSNERASAAIRSGNSAAGVSPRRHSAKQGVALGGMAWATTTRHHAGDRNSDGSAADKARASAGSAPGAVNVSIRAGPSADRIPGTADPFMQRVVGSLPASGARQEIAGNGSNRMIE